VIRGRLHPLTTLTLSLLAAALAVPGAAQRPQVAPAALVEPLTATAHPPLPRDPFRLWLAPREGSPASGRTHGPSAGARLYAEARYTQALTLLKPRPSGSPLAVYTDYYRGLTQLRLSQFDEARRTFEALLATPVQGYLSEAARLRLAEAAEGQGDARAAADAYAMVADGKPLMPEDVLSKLARARQAAGDLPGAAKAWARLYYEFPSSDEAALAKTELDQANAWQPLEAGNARYKLELGRGARLFSAKRYALARSSFELLDGVAAGDDRELVALRLAECDYYLKRYRAAHDALEPWTRNASRRSEARFFYLSATREMGARDEYVRLARELAAAAPGDSWTEETLNNLATHFIVTDDDASAEAVFRDVLQRFPESRHGERAAWRAGWWAYRRSEYDDTIRLFESAAARFPRSDYRPSWLYWSARAHDRLGQADIALARYSLVIADYQNSYYGRLAAKLVHDRGAEPVTVATTAARAGDIRDTALPDMDLPPTHELIRQLIAGEMYEDALNELQFAQRTWGDSPAIQATIGLVYTRTGELRKAINAMKRAYPQYIASGGEDLPGEMLKVLFPLDYWDKIRKYSAAHKLDPYLVAALTAQESTFDADIRSSANAVGLMQVLPSTGRRYARRIGIRRFRTSMLTRPDVNLRLGTAIFADLVKKFGGTHLALASYNAGDSAVARWIAERPGDIPRDEFIDDIPYPETQNYVRKILGTAEDYRMLYGTSATRASAHTSGAAATSGTAAAAKTPARAKKTHVSSRPAHAPAHSSRKPKRHHR
jgi:soluble lytic murein transglycosylase